MLRNGLSKKQSWKYPVRDVHGHVSPSIRWFVPAASHQVTQKRRRLSGNLIFTLPLSVFSIQMLPQTCICFSFLFFFFFWLLLLALSLYLKYLSGLRWAGRSSWGPAVAVCMLCSAGPRSHSHGPTAGPQFPNHIHLSARMRQRFSWLLLTAALCSEIWVVRNVCESFPVFLAFISPVDLRLSAASICPPCVPWAPWQWDFPWKSPSWPSLFSW